MRSSPSNDKHARLDVPCTLPGESEVSLSCPHNHTFALRCRVKRLIAEEGVAVGASVRG